MMEKILFVFPSISAGGAERNAIIISNYLVKKYDYKVSFFILDDSDLYLNLVEKKINIYQLKKDYKNLNKITQLFYTYFYFGFLVYRFSKGKNFNKIIGIHEIEPELALTVAFILFKLNFIKKVPEFISIIQTNFLQRYISDSNFIKKIKYLMLDFFRKRIFKNVIAVTSSIKEELLSKGCKNIEIIPNTIDTKYVKQKAEIFPDDIKYEITDNPFFLNIGRISRQKNQIEILKSFNKIKSQTNYNLFILGDIFDKNIHKKIINYITQNELNKRVFLLGVTNNPFYFINKAEAFVLSSDYEGFPLSILEAMCLNTLVISKKYPGYIEFLSNENSLLYSNEIELSEIMLNASSDKMKFEIIKKNAYDTAVKYDIENTGEIYHQFFSGIK